MDDTDNVSFDYEIRLLKGLENQLPRIFEIFKTELSVKVPSYANDPELESVWRAHLMEDLWIDRGEMYAFLSYASRFTNDRLLSKSTLTISRSRAEAILRVMTAVRLKIYEIALSDQPQEIMQDVIVHHKHLPPELAHLIFMYNLLSNLSETVIQSLLS